MTDSVSDLKARRDQQVADLDALLARVSRRKRDTLRWYEARRVSRLLASVQAIDRELAELYGG